MSGIRQPDLARSDDSTGAGRRRRHVVAVVAPSSAIVGGQAAQARALEAGLRGDGHEAIAVPIDPRFPRGLRWLRRLPYARTLVNEALYLPRLLACRHADVVHVFSASYWSFVLAPAPALLVARLLGRPAILHYHSGEAEDHFSRWRLTVERVIGLADAVVVPSGYLETVFGRFGFRARTIRNVVDTSRFRYRPRAPLRARLLSARSLEPHYGVDNTIRAFARLRARRPEATLTIAGDGSQASRLRALAGGLGLTGVRFVGALAPERLPALYDTCDIFVNSSTIDNQPVSVLEALAAGLPVVSTPAGDIPAMVAHGAAGTLVPADDPEALADAVGGLLDDPARAGRMAERGRRLVADYTWPAVRGRWTDLYDAVRATPTRSAALSRTARG